MNTKFENIRKRSMNMMMKLLGAAFFILHSSFFISCSDMFETDSDRQIFDPALDEKTDSMFYTLGILKGLQQLADQYVMTGEMRGDLTATNQYTETDLRRLANFSADATNKFDSAYIYYRVINNCNYYIAHRDTSLRTGSRLVAIPEYAEALAVRAWAYLQLCKNYGTVPFYTDPMVSIGQANSQLPQKDLQGICDALTPELIRYSGTPVPTYGNISAGVLNSSDSDNPQEKQVESSRTMIPVDVILGDLFLETHQYEQAARYYFNFLRVNQWTVRQAWIDPTESWIRRSLLDKLPAAMTISVGDYHWGSIFNITNTNDIITYIPLAANKLRGVVTELPRYFGYDFYSTTGGAASSTDRYLLERQIDASAAYHALNNAQEYYYTPTASTGGNTVVRTAELGDLRRFYTMYPVAKDDSSFNVMRKFNSANIPIYRTAMVYLRLAEALNRMGYPDAAFAILKDGINDDLLTYVEQGDPEEDLPAGRYIKPETATMLTTTVPFLSAENRQSFEDNWGIHSRGTYYTRGAFSPYQFHTIVGRKLEELNAQFSMSNGQWTKADTINAVEDIICDEMALELAFEGSRFGDLTRIARHKNHAGLYGADFGSQWLARKLAYKHPVVSLTDERNWYLPMK